MKTKDQGAAILYRSDDGKTAVEVKLKEDTVWLSKAQMADLFQRDQSVVSRHLRNIFEEGELPQKSNMQKMHIANSDKPAVLYSLDVPESAGRFVHRPDGAERGNHGQVHERQGLQGHGWKTFTAKSV